MKVLIVEDEAILAMNTKMILISLGHDVVGIADTGAEAIELVMNNIPDLILMDITLKGSLNGIETTKLLCAKFPECKIIFITAHADTITMDQTGSTKHMEILQKPLESNKLKRIISRLTA